MRSIILIVYNVLYSKTEIRSIRNNNNNKLKVDPRRTTRRNFAKMDLSSYMDIREKGKVEEK